MRTARSVCAILSLLSLGASALPAQPIIRSLTVNGNAALSDRELLESIGSRAGQPYSASALSSDVAALVDRYHRSGYLAAEVRPTVTRSPADTTLVDVAMAVREGRRTVVGRVSIAGLRTLSTDEALELFETRPGDPLDQAVLEEDIAALIATLERKGYPLARCGVDSLTLTGGPEEDSLAVYLTAEEGEKVRIGEIRVEGNRETDTTVILREIRFREGEEYDPVRVALIRERLNRLNIFSSVAEPELYFRGDQGGLLIRVQEGPTNTFDGLLGYVPSGTDGSGGYLTGLVAVGMRNLFGTGRKLNLRWQRDALETQELAIRYTEPWLFGAPVNLTGGFFQRQQDSSYVQRLVDGKAELLVSERLSLGLVVRSESVIAGEEVLATAAYSSSALTLGGEVQYDSRDDIYVPLSGLRYAVDVHYGRKTLPPGSSPDRGWIQRGSIDCEFYIPAFGRQVLAIMAHGRQLQGTQIQDGEMYRLGGARSLRGYREGEYLGSLVGWLNTEYRFIAGRRSFFFGLFDLGYYVYPGQAASGREKVEELKLGYGLGMRVDTAVGMIGVSIALGGGDALSQAKVHVGIVNSF